MWEKQKYFKSLKFVDASSAMFIVHQVQYFFNVWKTSSEYYWIIFAWNERRSSKEVYFYTVAKKKKFRKLNDCFFRSVSKKNYEKLEKCRRLWLIFLSEIYLFAFLSDEIVNLKNLETF